PDPMPIWLTIAIGIVGSVGGGAIAVGAGSRNAFVINTVGFVAAIALVVLYRRFVQKRPLTGPEALRFPKRGIGVEHARERLQRARAGRTSGARPHGHLGNDRTGPCGLVPRRDPGPPLPRARGRDPLQRRRRDAAALPVPALRAAPSAHGAAGEPSAASVASG